MPSVSIIVPIHNSGKYLGECLESIARQTLSDIEVLCIDDASTDNSLEVCRKFADEDSRFKVVSLDENIGVSSTRNKGIDLAEGDFLLFMDSDDWYPADVTVEHLYRAAIDHDVPIAGGEMSELDMRTGELRTDYRDDWHLHLYNFDQSGIVDYRDWQGDYGFTRFIYQRRLIEENGIRFPDLVRHEDPVFFVKAMVAAGRFYALAEPVYLYRVFHKTYELNQKDIDDAIEAELELLSIAEQNDLPVLRKYVVGTLVWYLTEESPVVRKQVQERMQEVYDSHSYRLGYALLWPVRAGRGLVSWARGLF